MTTTEAFQNFAYVAESNPRIRQLLDKETAVGLSEAEEDELHELYDDVFFSPFMFRNFLEAEDDFTEEDNARLKAQFQDMVDRGVIDTTPPWKK